MIRKPSQEPQPEKTPEEKEFLENLFANCPKPQTQPKKPRKSSPKKDVDNTAYTTPKYVIKHRSNIELEDFTEHKHAKMHTAIPKELVIEVNLPLLKSASNVVLDVTEKSIQLTSEKPAKYKLFLTLPYQVNQDAGNAKFDKDLKKLIITLPLKRSRQIYICDIEKSGKLDIIGHIFILKSESFISNQNPASIFLRFVIWKNIVHSKFAKPRILFIMTILS